MLDGFHWKVHAVGFIHGRKGYNFIQHIKTALREGTAQMLSFKWLRGRISTTDSKDRMPLLRIKKKKNTRKLLIV